MPTTSFITGSLGLAIAALIIVLIRRDRLYVNHGFAWILTALIFSLLGFAPGIFDWLALHLGVGYPPVLGLTVGLGILVLKALLMDIDRSHAAMRQERLIQRVGMLEADLHALEKRLDNKGL